MVLVSKSIKITNGHIKKNNDDIKFQIYVEDENYFNHDNPYGEIVLHRYTNMQN